MAFSLHPSCISLNVSVLSLAAQNDQSYLLPQPAVLGCPFKTVLPRVRGSSRRGALSTGRRRSRTTACEQETIPGSYHSPRHPLLLLQRRHCFCTRERRVVSAIRYGRQPAAWTAVAVQGVAAGWSPGAVFPAECEQGGRPAALCRLERVTRIPGPVLRAAAAALAQC